MWNCGRLLIGHLQQVAVRGMGEGNMTRFWGNVPGPALFLKTLKAHYCIQQ